MDNQDNPNCPINTMQNPEFFSPFKDSHYIMPPQGKDYKYIYQSSPFQSNIALNFTPSKRMDFPSGYCPSLNETPLLNLPFSPLPNNQRGDISNQRSQYQQRGPGFNEFSPFKPFYSPNNNQRISDKK